MSNHSELRRKFEKWADGFGRVFPLETDRMGDYLSVLTGNVWLLCQKAYDLGKASPDINASSEWIPVETRLPEHECKGLPDLWPIIRRLEALISCGNIQCQDCIQQNVRKPIEMLKKLADPPEAREENQK